MVLPESFELSASPLPREQNLTNAPKNDIKLEKESKTKFNTLAPNRKKSFIRESMRDMPP